MHLIVGTASCLVKKQANRHALASHVCQEPESDLFFEKTEKNS